MAVEATPHAAETIPELPNLITLLSHRWHEIPWVAWLHQWENIVFSAGVALA
ncbi:MAG: hypothetical protein HY353_04810, partial [Candidatus Omnitrophica bacterium]|nr:hypothetical protein [Candidatus Omnitrophota bacterium]